MSARPTGRRRRPAPAMALAGALLFGALLAGAAGCADDDRTGDTRSASDAVLGEPRPATGTPVRIGFANAEGGTAISRPEHRIATEATVKYVNSRLGGLSGHPIELVVCKDKSDGASGVACANRFVEEKVAAVVVADLADTDLYIPVLQAAGIPWVSVMPTGAQELSSPISFGLSGGTTSIFPAVAELAVARGLDDAVVLGPDVPFIASALKDVAMPVFVEAGIALRSVLVPPGTPDVSAQVVAALDGDPDLIWVMGDPTLCQALLPVIDTMNRGDAQVVTANTCAGPDVVDAVGADVVEGNVAVALTSAESGTPDAELFRGILQTWGEGIEAGQNATGFASLLGLVRAVNQVAPAGELDAAAVAAALRSARDVPLPGFPDATFTCDHRANPAFPALCSNYSLSATLRRGRLIDFQALD